MPTQRELEEMARDYDQMEREHIEQICREFILELKNERKMGYQGSIPRW